VPSQYWAVWTVTFSSGGPSWSGPKLDVRSENTAGDKRPLDAPSPAETPSFPLYLSGPTRDFTTKRITASGITRVCRLAAVVSRGVALARGLPAASGAGGPRALLPCFSRPRQRNSWRLARHPTTHPHSNSNLATGTSLYLTRAGGGSRPRFFFRFGSPAGGGRPDHRRLLRAGTCTATLQSATHSHTHTHTHTKEQALLRTELVVLFQPLPYFVCVLPLFILTRLFTPIDRSRFVCDITPHTPHTYCAANLPLR
jgi:hypothetical protein